MPSPRESTRFFAATSQGPRDEQQDSAICLHSEAHDTALLVVGDGVGGKRGGRLASQKLTELAQQTWETHAGLFDQPEKVLADLCRAAHEQINEEGKKLGISPRTTVVALYLTATHAWWTHSGDSRLYHFRAGELVERTEDHSLLEIMVQRGMVKEEEMGSHPEQGALLQSLGGEEFVAPSFHTVEVTPEDAFLLCTDGFWERTKVEEMGRVLFGGRNRAGAALDEAVARAVDRNGPKGDNVTVIVALPSAEAAPVFADVPAHPGRPGRLPPAMLASSLIGLVAILVLVWAWGGGSDNPKPLATTAAAPAPTPPAPAVVTPPPPPPASPTSTPSGTGEQIVETPPAPPPKPAAETPKPTPESPGPSIQATTPAPVVQERFYSTPGPTPAPRATPIRGGFHPPPGR